jgi:hypothetical protein
MQNRLATRARVRQTNVGAALCDFSELYTAERDRRHDQVTSFEYRSTEALWQSSAAGSHGLTRGVFLGARSTADN